jgi:hypothetical protein
MKWLERSRRLSYDGVQNRISVRMPDGVQGIEDGEL